MTRGARRYGIGSRYSISWCAMSVRMSAPGRPSSTGVLGPSSPDSSAGSSVQNAWMRASSRRRSISALLTCWYASRSDQRSRMGTSSLTSGGSAAGELAVGGAVRTRRLRAEPLDLVLLVRLEVALEPVPARGVLVGALVG